MIPGGKYQKQCIRQDDNGEDPCVFSLSSYLTIHKRQKEAIRSSNELSCHKEKRVVLVVVPRVERRIGKRQSGYDRLHYQVFAEKPEITWHEQQGILPNGFDLLPPRQIPVAIFLPRIKGVIWDVTMYCCLGNVFRGLSFIHKTVKHEQQGQYGEVCEYRCWRRNT